MNQTSGLGEDTDVAFVLTTNRPDALEPALAARPGRVDLAVEIPLPDRDGRRRLFDLYSRGLDVAAVDAGAVIDRTEGVTASFIKELLRKAALFAAEDGRTALGDAGARTALDELLSQASTMTRVLLGVADGKRAGSADPAHGWMRRSRTTCEYLGLAPSIHVCHLTGRAPRPYPVAPCRAAPAQRGPSPAPR
jgi:SpoVK/Ycf46/Vps4 family AAA+-type ATPase